LDAADNKELVTTTDTMNAVHLVWRGLNRFFFASSSYQKDPKGK